MSGGYLLDTNVCVALISGQPPQMPERLADVGAAGAQKVPRVVNEVVRYIINFRFLARSISATV